MRRFALLALLLCVAGWTGVAEAQSTAGAQSLLITPGARADGMGRAYIAAANDPTTVWWNPGALAGVTTRSATLMHTKLVPGLADDVYYEYLGYSQPLEGVGGVGANIIYLTYGKSTAVTDEEQELGEFSSYEIAGTGSIGFQVNSAFSFGAALKVVYVNLAPAWATPEGRKGSGSSFAVDVGGLYQIPTPLFASDNLRLAAVVTNLGPKISFIDEGQSSPLGRIIKVGMAYQLFDTGQYAFQVAYDFNQPIIVPESEEPIHNVGAEVLYSQNNIQAAVRLGYIYDPEGTIEDPTFGLGFGLGRLQIDWAMVPQSKFLEENVHKFSLTAKI